jgi:hypothetical protein
VIASFHTADVGKLTAAKLLAQRPRSEACPGLRYAVLTTTAPLSEQMLPRLNLGRVALVAAWQDERALERFLAEDRLAAKLKDGWRVRLQPTHVFGEWPPLAGLVQEPVAMDPEEPAAALTIGRLRLTQGGRFLAAGAAAERLVVADPELLQGTGLARPPGLVATFSLWRTVRAMRAYAGGVSGGGHRAAVKAHAERPFHHASAFIRFRPYGAVGEWNGESLLADDLAAPAPLA